MKKEASFSPSFSLIILGFFVALLWASSLARAEKDFPTLLPAKTVDAIIAHASGDIAYQHIRRISLFNRLAASEAYHRSAEYVLTELKKYGLDDAHIEQYPADGKTWYYMFQSFHGWDGESGVVWLVSPHREKIADFMEMPACLCRWSNSAQVRGELIYVGAGRPEDFDGKDVKNKIVLTSSSPGPVHEEAVFNRGALGVISFSYPRPLDYPDPVERDGISHYETSDGRKSTFAFKISYRKGQELLRMLEGGQKLELEVDVKARVYPSQYENVIATIKGTDPEAEEFLLTAHLCHFDPGANDNASGAATILEIARALKELIATGEIEPPRRTIRFIWIPEMSGSYAYAATHPERTDKIMCGLNLDMVGSYLNRNNSGFYFHLTPDSMPHFINDVVANFADFVGQTNTEFDYYSGYSFTKPILSGQGSRDSFRYKILPFMGGSDHRIYNDRLINVPMVFFNVWPDPYYETNLDTPDKCDPTTMRRAAVVAVASAVFITGPKPNCFALAGEVYGRGLARIGEDIKKALHYFNKGEFKDLETAYKEADNVVRFAFVREKKAISSVSLLDPQDASLSKYIADIARSYDSQEKRARLDIWNHYLAIRGEKKGKLESLKLSKEEIAAQDIIPFRNEKLRGPLGIRYVVTRGGMNPLAGASPIMRDERVIYEVFNFIDGKNSVLDIRNAASAEYSPIPLPDVQRFMEALAKAEVIRLRTASAKRQ